MGERGFETPTLGGDLWSMGFDVVLALDTHSSRKSNNGTNSVGLSSTSPIGNGNVNISYSDMLLHRFDDDLNEGDIAQITDLTNSLPKGDVESAQSFLAKIACQDLTRELNEAQISPQKSIEASLFASVSEGDSHNANSVIHHKQYLQPVDVYGRVSLYEGKLILQLKHFNANTNYPINVSECWLCKEKMSNGSQIHSHKHALQGLFQVNDEFVQMDIDHYIIPEQALEPDPSDVNRNLTSGALIVSSDPSTIGHINSDRSLGLGEIIECSQALQDDHVNLVAIGNSLQAPQRALMTSTESLETSKVNAELQYTETELNNAMSATHQSLNSTVAMNSNTFLNTFTSDLKMDGPVTIVPTPNESVLMSHVTDSISPTSASTFPSSSLTLSTCNNNAVTNGANLIASSCISVANGENLIGSSFITQSHSTLNDINNIQELCTSSHEEPRSDSFIDHTTYEPNIGNKEQLESYQNFFGSSYSYAYENSELSSQLPKIPADTVRSLELPSSELCDSVIEQNCSVPKLPEIKKTIEVGAKKRKSKAHKKPSRIKMRDERESPLEPLLFENKKSNISPDYNKCEIVAQNELTEIRDTSDITEVKDNTKSLTSYPIIESKNISETNSHAVLSSSRVSAKEPFTISCPSCSLIFPSENISEFKNHINIHNFEPSYLFFCPVCSKKVSGSLEYIQHVKMHSGKRHFCSKCDAHYSRADKLRMHIITVHDSKKSYVCDICSKAFTRLEYLKSHKNIHLGKKFECDVCHGFYSSMFNLHIHKISHSDKLPHSCNLCDKAFIRKDLLDQHIAKDHKNRRYKCDICSKLYSRKDVLRRHKETHDDKRVSYNCEICNKKFHRKDSLKTHSYKHQDSKNENAEAKPRVRKTKTKEMLMKFEKQHKEQCNICLKYLPSSLKLEKHLQWHQSQLKLKSYFERDSLKSYKCETCSKSFRTKKLIKKHILRAHNHMDPEPIPVEERQENEQTRKREFICEVCSKGFTRSSSLKSHLKTHLKIDTDDDEILAEIPTVLNASKVNALKEKHYPPIEIMAASSSPNAMLDGISKDTVPNVSNLRLLLEGNLVAPNSYNASFGSNLSGELPNTSFCSSPTSPINLSTEAISAAAYLLTHPFYEGTYQ